MVGLTIHHRLRLQRRVQNSPWLNSRACSLTQCLRIMSHCSKVRSLCIGSQEDRASFAAILLTFTSGSTFERSKERREAPFIYSGIQTRGRSLPSANSQFPSIDLPEF